MFLAVVLFPPSPTCSIDSKPVKVCQNARAKRCSMGKTDMDHAPSWGYCASQNMHYYGYKLHALCGTTGVIHSYDMTAANVHDLHYLKDIHPTEIIYSEIHNISLKLVF